jgi:serine/threonine protein kinase
MLQDLPLITKLFTDFGKEYPQKKTLLLSLELKHTITFRPDDYYTFISLTKAYYFLVLSNHSSVLKYRFITILQGVIDGSLVAVKKLFKASKENEPKLEKELSLVSNIEHPNILKLLGYCFEEDQYLFVYEYMPNGSLDRYCKGIF